MSPKITYIGGYIGYLYKEQAPYIDNLLPIYGNRSITSYLENEEMIKTIKYLSILLLLVSLAIHSSTFGTKEIFTMDSVWFMQVAVIAVFGVMMYVVRKLIPERKREPGQKYVDWFRENMESQMMDKNKFVINAIPGTLFFLGIIAIIYFAINFVSCMFSMEFGGPQIENGKYFLMNHGKIIRPLTESEFHKMKSFELRLFSWGWVIFSYIPTLFFTFVYPATLKKREQDASLNR